jgi:hypothetical protein
MPTSKYRTPMDKLNENYINRTGSFTPHPAAAAPSAPDLAPGAVRRGQGGIWEKIREGIGQMLTPMHEQPGSPASQIAPGPLRAGTPGFEGTWKGPTIGDALGHPAGQAVGSMGAAGRLLSPGPTDTQNKFWQAMNRGPTVGDFMGTPTPLNQPAPAQAAAASSAQQTMNPRDLHAQRYGPPSKTPAPSQNPAGAPTGNTALSGQPPPAQAAQTPAQNRYMEMYNAGTAAQEKFFNSIPAANQPIETIRGVPGSASGKADPNAKMQRGFWSPVHQNPNNPATGEYGTKLEAAMGKSHGEEMGLKIEADKNKTELEKTRMITEAKGEAKPAETKLATVFLPDGSQAVYDSGRGKFMTPDGKQELPSKVQKQASEKLKKDLEEQLEPMEVQEVQSLAALYRATPDADGIQERAQNLSPAMRQLLHMVLNSD